MLEAESFVLMNTALVDNKVMIWGSFWFLFHAMGVARGGEAQEALPCVIFF